MKTPREILFERHFKAEPRLDAARREVLARLPASQVLDAPEPWRGARLGIGAALRRAWLELVWPSRRAWAGMAALWILVLAANLEMNFTSGAGTRVRSVPAGVLAHAFEERRRLLAELLPPVKAPLIQTAPASPRPRSERPATLRPC